MIHALRAVDRRFLAPAPPERLAIVRVLVGAYALVYLGVRTPALLRLAEMPGRDFAPVSPVAFLSSPVPALVLHLALAAALASGVAFVRGSAFRLTGPLFALLLLFLTSYRTSFGMIFHTDNLLVLHVLVLACVPAAADVLAPGRPLRAPPSARSGWPLHVLGLVTVTAYLMAGIAKLKGLGLEWVEGEVLMGHVAYDALRKISVGAGASSFGIWLLGVPWVWGPLAATSLAIELLAPLALAGRLLGRVWCGLAWGFHLGVAAMMWIGFPYPLSGIAYASFWPVEQALRAGTVERALARLTGARRGPPAAGTMEA